MSYHIVSISEESCRITVNHQQLEVHSNTHHRKIPLEDVGAIIITSLHCQLSMHFLTSAARNGIGIVLCDQYKPAALLLPAIRPTSTEVLRNLAKISPQLGRRLWQKTVSAKCLNQSTLTETWDPGNPDLRTMRQLAISNKEHKEAAVAKYFWKSFATATGVESFRRGREAGGFNSLFNYAYAILLSYTLGRLFALGLDPCFGIHHAPRTHAAPLAYDLMEPFRPAFDAHIMHWIQHCRSQGAADEAIAEVSHDFKSYMMMALLRPVDYQGRLLPLRHVIELTLRSFRAAIIAQKSSPYEPWILSTIKWDG